MGHDAVADVIAKQYGTSKENVLNPHGDGSAAVRLALGETQIVANTRKFLEQEGVYLDAFNDVIISVCFIFRFNKYFNFLYIQSSGKRSKTIILVKNLPAETEPREIRELFEKHGVLNRVIFPPSGITGMLRFQKPLFDINSIIISAIVEFIEPSEARKAFMNLAYKKFKHLPLYLEWAPENSLSPASKHTRNESDKPDKEEVTEMESNDVEEEREEQERAEEEEDEEEPEPDTTLFVKNLNFQTTDEVLRQV